MEEILDLITYTCSKETLNLNKEIKVAIVYLLKRKKEEKSIEKGFR